jgi:hypothetical protein
MSTVINQGIKISDLSSISNLESGDLLLVAEKSGQTYATKKIDASYINNLRTVAANLGSSGAEVYQGSIGGEGVSQLALRFRRIVAGDDVSITQTTDSIRISVIDALKTATNQETWDGTVTNKAVTPASLASKTSSDNAGDYIVKRDYYGNFAANVITASLNGNSATATKLVAARTIRLTGDITGSVATDLSGDVTISTALYGIVPPGVPPGAIIMYAANNVPMGYVACNGGTYNRTGTYANLFAAIGTTYGAPSSTTFQVPDLRGYFVRGHGTNTDGTASGNFGEKQVDTFVSHRHSFSDYYERAGGSLNLGRRCDLRGDGGRCATDGGSVSISSTGGSTPNNTNFVGGAETRPKNIALLYCIRY